MKNKPELTNNVTHNNNKKVKIIFKQPMRNLNISYEMYAEAKNAYLAQIEAEHGRKLALPNELQMISHKVQELFEQPYIYQTDIAYEIDAADAEKYLAKHVEYIDDSKPRHFNDISDVAFYKKKFHFAEIVA